MFALLAKARTQKGQPPAVNLKEAIVRVAKEVKAFRTACKIHCFKPKDKNSSDIALEAIVAPPSGVAAAIKEKLGFKIQRVTLPRSYQNLVTALEGMMGGTKEIASEIEALHRRVQADYDGSDDAIRSFTKGADKNLGGDTKLRKVLKERGNDKNVINQAVTSAKHNLTRLGKVMDLWKKQHRKTEAWCATPPENTSGAIRSANFVLEYLQVPAYAREHHQEGDVPVLDAL